MSTPSIIQLLGFRSSFVGTPIKVRSITNDSQWKGVDTRVVLSSDTTPPENGFIIDATEYFGAPTCVKVYINAKKVYGDYFNRSDVSDTSANQG